jgi:hypothetical protein
MLVTEHDAPHTIPVPSGVESAVNELYPRYPLPVSFVSDSCVSVFELFAAVTCPLFHVAHRTSSEEFDIGHSKKQTIYL